MGSGVLHGIAFASSYSGEPGHKCVGVGGFPGKALTFGATRETGILLFDNLYWNLAELG